MTVPREDTVYYRRSRFTTHLPRGRRYSPAHYWLLEETPGTWRIGFTKFATRMLGEAVEIDFEAKPGSAIETGEVIGWLEGFKAVTDLYAPITGSFEGANPDLAQNMEMLTKDPYDRGWVFRVRGNPQGECIGVDAYIAKSAEFARPILAHLREVVHAACPDVEETMKWSFPHFEYRGLLCSMAAFKEHCAFGFWKGSLVPTWCE